MQFVMQTVTTATVMFCCCCCCLFFPSRGIQVVLRYYNFNLGKILLRKYFGLQLKAAGELHFPKTFLDPWNPMSTMKHIFRARLTPFSSKKRNHHNSQTPGTESLQILPEVGSVETVILHSSPSSRTQSSLEGPGRDRGLSWRLVKVKGVRSYDLNDLIWSTH